MSKKYKLPPWSFRDHDAIRKYRDPINALVAAMGHESASTAVVESAINEILEADRAARPFAPDVTAPLSDPRISQLAELQRLAVEWIGLSRAAMVHIGQTNEFDVAH